MNIYDEQSNVSGFVTVRDIDGRVLSNNAIQIQLLNSKLGTLFSDWTARGQFAFPPVEPGIYVLRAKLANGSQADKVIDLQSGAKIIENLELTDLKFQSSVSVETIEILSKGLGTATGWRTLIGNVSILDPRALLRSSVLWIYENNSWRIAQDDLVTPDIYLPNGGVTLRLPKQGHFGLEISSSEWPSKFFCLPPAETLNLTISYVRAPDDSFNPIQVKIQSEHWESETLLTLLSRGPVSEEDGLFREVEAEYFLQGKLRNPAAAVIGGYYLLKIRAIDRMHDWANNLANWFPWIPDGPVIHAWQLMAKVIKNPKDISTIRKRLLEAHRRGIPHYTEGLKLLHDGLERIGTFYKGSDFQIQSALRRVRSLVALADLSQPTTTLNNFQPGTRNISSRKFKD
jgi:hypothetical protein